jgi:hypothetical protein
MKLREWTGLGRPVDLNVPSNRFVILGSGLAAALAFAITYLTKGEIAVLDSGLVGVAAFLAWAIARELDPDSSQAAGAALIISTAFSLVLLPALGAVVITMLALRILVGTVGSRLTILDLAVLIGASAVVASDPLAWPGIGVLVYALRRSNSPYARSGKVGVAIAAGTGVVLSGAPLTLTAADASSMVLFGLVVAAVAFTVPVSRVASMCDDGTSRIDPSKLSLARVLAIPISAWAAISTEAGVAAIGPLVAAVIGVSIAQLLRSEVRSRPVPAGSR